MADNSVDAVVTDPPAGIGFMGKDWDADKGGRDAWIAWLAEVMREALRVTKPGAHALVWALPRTSHWTGMAIEDGRWEIRDAIDHVFGSGFPKSKNIGDGRGTALKPMHEVWFLARKPFSTTVAANVAKWGTGGINVDACRITGIKQVPASGRTQPRTDGFGMRGDETTAGFDPTVGRWPPNFLLSHSADCADDGCSPDCPVAAMDRQSGERTSGFMAAGTQREGVGYRGGLGCTVAHDTHGDSGGASRFAPTFTWEAADFVPFLYEAKPPTSEKEAGLGAPVGVLDDSRDPDAPGANNPRNRSGKQRANVHPTVKSIALMSWLCRLVTPPGGLVLDPFAGSGTTGIAALRQGFRFIGIEQHEPFVRIARRRIEEDAPLFARNSGAA
jgi:site-specific DNA-methyltransferase (adenine-specific)